MKQRREFVFAACSAALLAVFFVLTPVPVQAENGNADEQNSGITSGTNLEFQISSQPEAKLRLNQTFTFPFLAGQGPLTAGNNITAALAAEVTPVSASGSGELRFTPAAFFVLAGGGRAGSGWNIPIADGIGLNIPEDSGEDAAFPRKSVIDGTAFDGLQWSAWGAGTAQFDLAAIFPGDWNHVLFQSRQEFRYSAYTRAHSRDSWIFENDDGENQNGWVYYGSYVLGYQMPASPVLNMVAVMAELQKPLYRTPGGDFWGEDLGRWIFSTLFNFSVTPRFSTAFAVQMRTRRNYGFSNFTDNNDNFYQDLEVKEGEGRRRLLFYRAALIFNYKIR